MNDEIIAYQNWNRTLWNYFFPKGTEDAILYLDDSILEQVATEAGLRLPAGVGSFEDFFLSSTLLSSSHLDLFLKQLRIIPSLPEPRPRPKKWDKLVEFLMLGKIRDIPAYFAMLCAILYLAGKCGAVHEEMRNGAQRFLGEGYHGKFGELVDPLLQKLHNDVTSFNQNRMICGTQRHMSRIKFHLVLPRSVRDDFVDFVEINSLRWDWAETPYSFYIDNILVPSLSNAGKHDLAKKVTEQENIPYFKSILQSDLEFGKKKSRFDNTVQEKELRWKYQLCFDYCGKCHFYIISDYILPFGVELQDGRFQVVGGTHGDYIAEDVLLKAYAEEKFTWNGLHYSLSNICSGQRGYGGVFFFQELSDDSYIQVDAPIIGEKYYAFVRDSYGRVPNAWSLISDVAINGYSVYEIASFSGRQSSLSSTRVKLEDTFCRQSMGSWYSIKLDENQNVYWTPNEIDGQQEQIEDLFKNANGFTFFQIPFHNPDHLSGTLIVKKGEKELLSEPIFAKFEWKGKGGSYHVNGWGEIEQGESTESTESNTRHAPLRRSILSERVKSTNREPNILLQLIYESADITGCIPKRKLEMAIGFALSYYGFALTPERSRSIIYGLRRLGYLVKFEKDDRVCYQLTAPYLEKTNYSFKGVINAYLVKGVYSQSLLSQLLSSSSVNASVRIRPYENDTSESHPEYICLPDQVLIEKKGETSWKTRDYPMAEQILISMESIKGFVQKFGIGSSGDIYRGVPPLGLPGMVKNSRGSEVLCTKQNDGSLVVHPYYNTGGVIKPIPKHLSRLYSQVQRNVPVCIMGYKSKNVVYSHITFVNNMGVPELLDIALCDLNLVIPSYKRVFIVDQGSLGIPARNPWTEKRTYTTHAMTNEHSFMLTWLSKLAGKTITDITKEPNSIFLKNRVRDYDLYLTKNFSYHKDLLALYYGDHLSAFSLGQDVYYYETRSKMYRKVSGTDVNHILSIIIKNKQDQLTLCEEFTASIEKIKNSNGTEISIIERVNI